MRRSLIAPGVLSVLVGGGLAGEAAPPETQTVQSLGPFLLGASPKHGVHVVATYRQAKNTRTLESWTIRDQAGTLLFREGLTIGRQPDGGFAWSVSLTASLLTGQGRRFLLVQLDEVPSAPSAGTTYVVFGFDGYDRFRPMGKLVKQGSGLRNPVDQNGHVALAQGRYLEMDVWLHYFALTIRYGYDEGSAAFVALNRCEVPRDFHIDPARMAARASGPDNFVALFARPDPAAPQRRIPVNRDAKIVVSQACVEAPPSPGNADTVRPWLRIRIDGHDGWVTEPDFERLGLAFSG